MIYPSIYTHGWWYTYSSEKYESQLGWLFLIYGKKIQTTNQIDRYIYIFLYHIIPLYIYGDFPTFSDVFPG
jgi:hypothetical protein